MCRACATSATALRSPPASGDRKRFGRPLDPAARHPRQADPQMGRHRRGRLDRAQLPRLRGLRPAAGLQALRGSEGSAARQPPAAAQRPDDPRARHRRAAAGHQGARRPPLEEVLRTAVARRRPPRRLRSGRIPRRHPDADPRRRRHLPQTLDPARQLRRNPRPEPAEDQRRLLLRRRQAADRSRRTVPRHPGRPRRDRRLHRLRRPDRRGRRGDRQRPAQALHRHLRRRRRRPGRLHAAARQGREHPRRRRKR